jgi:hypothetical protein
MGKILIFNAIREIAMNQKLDNAVLFGEENFIDDGNHVYDLIFHVKQTDPYKVEKVTSLVIPVFKAENEDEAISRIYHNYQNYPSFSKFAVLQEGQKFLDFYEVLQQELGKEIKLLGKYNTVDEKKFYDFSEDEECKLSIDKKRRMIEEKYPNTV